MTATVKQLLQDLESERVSKLRQVNEKVNLGGKAFSAEPEFPSANSLLPIVKKRKEEIIARTE